MFDFLVHMKPIFNRSCLFLSVILSVLFSVANAQEAEPLFEPEHGAISMQGEMIIDVTQTPSSAISAAVAGVWRSADNRVRDPFRHPIETLEFFGVKPTDTVIEITPGNGWYAEILAPFLREQGIYIAAVVDPDTLPAGDGRDFQRRARNRLDALFAAAPDQFGRVQVVSYDPVRPVLGGAESADVVLTFRNVHNWRMAGQAEGMFRAFFDVLKSGGTLGVVEHRATENVSDDDRSGYVGQAQLIAMAEKAGFTFMDSSEINANPRDPKNHPNGVWMLPPSNRHAPENAAIYQAIGESDRMTLRFIKP